MSRRRIAVTGLGVVSCFGSDVDQFFASLLNGKSGIAPITTFPCEDFPTRFGGCVTDFNTDEWIDKKQARRIDPFIAYAMVAGKKALRQAGLENEALAAVDKTRAGVIIGSGMGGMGVFVDGTLDLDKKGHRRVSPFFVPYILTNMAGALLAMDIGFMGPNYSVSTACATSNFAIIGAAEHIRRGEADVIVCGGTEAAINAMGLAGFCACKALSQRNDAPEKASRPWDKNRDGFVMGEGAGVIILEDMDHAIRRGAKILCEYLGGAISCDAYHMTEPRADGEGVALCIRNALADAQLNADQINYINAHATSTPAGDMAEVRALKKVFATPEKIVMNSTKSMIGHCLGAAAGVEAVATIKSIMDQKVHPTINLEDPEEGLDFFIPKKEVAVTIQAAISNSFGFGGHNASVIFGAYAS